MTIAKIEPSNSMQRDFVVADIENRSDGSVLSIQTYDGKDHATHGTWGEWYSYVRSRARNDTRYRKVYAHNGGGWDWLSFIEWMVKHDRSQTFYTIQNGHRIVSVIVGDPDSDNSHRPTIRLVDSLFLLGGSLDSVAEKLLGERKIKLEHLPEWYWENDRQKYWDYSYRDTDLLYRSLHKFMDVVWEQIAHVGKIGLTLPSTSLRCFQTGYLDRDIPTPKSEGAKTALRNGYVGGRVEVFKAGYYENIRVYDFNSLYPSVMLDTPVPVGGEPQQTSVLNLDRCGVYHVRFVQRDTSRLPLLMVDGLGVYRGTGWYYTNELRRLATLGNGRIKVLSGYTFRDNATIFRKYVETLYAFRLTDRNGPLGNVAKLMMNSLYGKFAQKTERTKVVYAESDAVKAMVKAGVGVELLNPELGLYRVSETQSTPFEHVGIAGTITSEARARLWESFDSGTVYCDTDSIHTTGHLPIDDTGLGKLKLEFEGEGVYCGKKLYALRNEAIEKIRVKGVRVGGENGHPLSFDSLLQVAQGASIECHFKGAATSTQVFRGEKSCVFYDRKRTIRKTANVG